MIPKLSKLVLASGDTIDVSHRVTAIVGPNNAGKTRLLGDLSSILSRLPGQELFPLPEVVTSVEVEPASRVEDIMTWLEERFGRREPGIYGRHGQIPEPHYALNNGNIIRESDIQRSWNSRDRFGALYHALALHLGAQERLGVASGSGQSFDLLEEQPNHPIQHLYKDRELEKQISDVMEQAFGEPLIVNRYAGQQIPVHVGSLSVEETKPPPSDTYLRELKQLPLLRDQGDGVRAFVGILMSIVTTKYPITIIDEPEAFLHPPQAYLLGKLLAESGSQVIIATHSQDVIQGLTASSSASDVSIVRLTRSEPKINHAHQVAADTMRELYEDPLIKYYGILNGLFYQGTILCEADSDCTYYRTVLDSIDRLPDGRPTSAVSLHFTHCGGKDRLPKAVRALRAANVPVACAVDFDLLQVEKDFVALVSAYGGDPDTLAPLRNDVLSTINSKARKVRRGSAKLEVNQILDAKTTDELSSGELSRLAKALKASSGWQEAKLYGRGLLSGQALTSFNRLNFELRKLGIFLVEVGELERFHREIPANNKAAWLRAVLEQRLYLESQEAKEYVRAMVSYVQGLQ
ncbi:ATP-dependent nuclease [Actinomadura verrucosospora]